MQKFDAAYFRGRKYFEGNDGTQNDLVFQPVLKYFKNKSVEDAVTGNLIHKIYTFSKWKSKGYSENLIKAFIKINNLIACPGLIHDGFNSILEFRGQCLKTELDIYHQYTKIINMYIVYELSPNTYKYNFNLKNCLFGSVNVIQDMILISAKILDMVLDSIQEEIFHILMVALLKT